MGAFSHSQGTVSAQSLTNLFLPTTNEASDFPAELMTSGCAVPTVSLVWPHTMHWSNADAVDTRKPGYSQNLLW